MDLKDIVDNYIFSSDLKKLNLDSRCVINTINPHSYCVAKTDPLFQKALLQSDILLPDGFGIVLLAKILRGNTIKKIAGADIHQHLLSYANANGKKIFYLGASPSTLALITAKIKKDYPNIQASSYSPPYKPEFSIEDSKAMIEAVNTYEPDILFVGMTAPKQEKWVEAHKAQLSPGIITSIGAVFDFYAGTVQRSGPFWIKLGLEWLPRLVREPRRLWKRNFISTPLFMWYLAKSKFKLG